MTATITILTSPSDPGRNTNPVQTSSAKAPNGSLCNPSDCTREPESEIYVGLEPELYMTPSTQLVEPCVHSIFIARVS